MPRRQTFVVELLGPPGAGKSTLAAELAKRPGVRVVKDHSSTDLPVLIWAALRALPILPQVPAGVSRLRWVAWAGRLGAATVVAGRRTTPSTRVVVLDQGPAYTLTRMAGARRTARGYHWWLHRSMECAALLDLLVVLDAETSILGRRLHVRGKAHRADDLEPAALQEYLDHERAVCAEVGDVLARQGATVRRLRTDRHALSEQVAAIERARDRAPTRRRVRP